MERRRRRMRRSSPAGEPVVGLSADDAPVEEPVVDEPPRSPTPNDIAEMGGTFAMTAEVLDPEVSEPEEAREDPAGEAEYERPASDEPVPSDRPGDDQQTERGLRGLVGGGSSQVSVGAALRARDAARPTDADLAAAERDLVIVRRGWVPREDLPPRAPRR
jgi:hypothetical protein